MSKVIIYLNDSGKGYEIREDTAGLGIYNKVKGFKYIDKAREFAEKEALEKGLELVDTTIPRVGTVELPDHSQSVDPEEKLLRAIFGDSYREDKETK